jgi:hypothetical protein
MANRRNYTLPLPHIRKIAAFRVKEEKNKDAKWM